MSIRPFEGSSPAVHPSAHVDERALVIGDVRLGADTSVWPMCVVRADIQRIEIGARSNIQDASVLHVTHDSEYHPGGQPLIIGDEVTVGHHVLLHACTVEDACLIGMGSIVLDGAIIRSGALLGAGALVPPGKDLEGGYLWVGRPARRRRALNDREREYMRYSAAHYVRLKDRHAGLSISP
jgi:carbonic anhydrase/acetyltransferase-like protein (isoleucine patch superfamily)